MVSNKNVYCGIINHKNNVVVTECYATYLLGGPMHAHGYELNVICLHCARVSKHADLSLGCLTSDRVEEGEVSRHGMAYPS